AEAWLAGLGPDRRLVQTAFGLFTVGKTLVGVLVVAWLVLPRLGAGALRRMTPGVVVAVIAAATLVAVPAPGVLPVPGVPLLGDVALAGTSLPVLVVPQRPGWNLVHVGGE